MKILRFLLNKYFIATLIFLGWMVFFDSNNILTRGRLKSRLEELQKERKFYRDEIRKDSTLLREITTDTAKLEKFARERYLMKKEGEDVFLMIDTTGGQHPQ